MTQPPPVQRTPAGLAFLDDARKRRKQRRRPPKPPKSVEPQPPDAELEDSSAYALDLAVDLLDSESEAPARSADEILAQHEAASKTTPVRDDPRSDGPADEILLALEAQHQRVEPHERHSAPRGSADLDEHQPQRPRAKPAKSARPRRTLKQPHPSGRLVAAGGLATILLAAAIAINGAGGGITSSAADHPTAGTTNVGAASLAAGDFPTHGLLLAGRHQTTANTHTRRHLRHTSRPPKRPAASHHTAAVAASSRPPSATGASSAASNTPATAASSSSTPAVSDSQSSSSSNGSSSPQPAGPAGAGGTVGGNCDPKCS